MKLPPRAQRISLHIDDEKVHSSLEFVERLAKLPGVIEATLVEDEQRVYLKVENDNYKPELAQEILAS
jgi:nitrate reductase NapAB chaperone NapD